MVRIEVAFISGKTFIQEASYSARIVDLKCIEFRHLFWIKSIRFEIFLELIFVFFRIRTSSDHRNLQLQDLLRQETNAFHSYINIAFWGP